MNDRLIGIFYFANAEAENEIISCENKLNEIGLSLYKKDLSGKMFNAALDFADIDIIIMSGNLLLQQLALNGTYDLLKATVVKLWSAMRRVHNNMSKIPFSIRIGRIPTPYGDKDITFKIVGDLSEKQKTLVINRAFDTVQKISEGNIHLMEKAKANEEFGGAHLLRIDPQKLSVSEIDIDAEIQKKVNS